MDNDSKKRSHDAMEDQDEGSTEEEGKNVIINDDINRKQFPHHLGESSAETSGGLQSQGLHQWRNDQILSRAEYLPPPEIALDEPCVFSQLRDIKGKRIREEITAEGTDASFDRSSLWERKSAILQEELDIRKQEQQALQRQLEMEIESRKEEEHAVRQQLGTKKYASGGDADQLESQLHEAISIRQQLEQIIETQRLEIKKLSQAASIDTKPSAEESKEKWGHATDRNSVQLQDDLMRSRQKQIELMQALESWKQKALGWQKKIELVTARPKKKAPKTESTKPLNIARTQDKTIEILEDSDEDK